MNMVLTVSSLKPFFNGQFMVAVNDHPLRGGLNGPDSLQLIGEDFKEKQLTIKPIWLLQGNLRPNDPLQMWKIVYTPSQFIFNYRDKNVEALNGVVSIKTQNGE